MPSIEFLGYSRTERERLADGLRDSLREITFVNEIVFVFYDSEVVGFDNQPQPYLRVSTRNSEKAGILMDKLALFADVEFLKSEDIVFKKK